MASAEPYRDLKVWQRAIELSFSIYKLTEAFPGDEMYGLTSQIRRASVSTASNIAEGQGRCTAGEFRQFLGIARGSNPKASVVYAEGCKITSARPGFRGWFDDNVKLIDPQTQAESIHAAAEVARKADVSILVVGENESTNREAWSEGHLGDRDSLDLVGAQNSLVQAVVETGTPTVVLLINGRPLSINYIAEHVPAILEGWYLGEEGGTAAARVLFGDVNPGGKLPITFPHSVGDLPDFYNRKPSTDRGYAFGNKKPLYPFGYGLSYTKVLSLEFGR